MNRQYLEDACEQIDAAVFSGDTLYDDDDRAALKEYVQRWVRAIDSHEENAKETCAFCGVKLLNPCEFVPPDICEKAVNATYQLELKI
jgi:hypothetical protein